MSKEILIKGEEIKQEEFHKRRSRKLEREDILRVLSGQPVRVRFVELAVAGRVIEIHTKLLGNITVEGFEIQITSKEREEWDKAETLIHEIAHIHFGWDMNNEGFIDEQVEEFLSKNEERQMAVRLFRKVRDAATESLFDVWTSGSSWEDKQESITEY